MAERRTLLSQASQATEPLRAAPINAPAGAFGDARGLGSFGNSLESAGYQTGQHASRKLSELYQKADAIAGARIRSQYSVGVSEASTALTQAVEDAKNRGLRGDELTNFIKAQVAPFEASMDKSMDVLAKQYPAKFEELVTKEQRAATWAGMQNQQIESGINYTNTKNQEDSLANEVKGLNNRFYEANTGAIATLGTGVLEMAKVDANVLLDAKNKVAFQTRIREHVASNFSALIETVAFPAALESAFEKKVIAPQDYAALKHARQAWEKAGGARPGATANYIAVRELIESGQYVPADRISGALAGVLPGYKTSAEQFTGAIAPFIISDTVGSFRRRVMSGVNPAGKAQSVEQAHQILARGLDDKDAFGFVMSYLKEGVAQLNNGENTPKELKDPSIQIFTQSQIAEAYTKMFSLVKEQNDLIQAGHGAKVFLQDRTVRMARDAIEGKGNADEYIKALFHKYAVNGVEDPALQDISDPTRLSEIDDLLKLNTAESLDKAVKKTQEYRALFGVYARESMLRTSSRNDNPSSGLIGITAEVGKGFNEQNSAEAESMLAMATTAVAWMNLPETKELLARESVGAGQGIKLMEQRIGYNLDKDDEDFAQQARSEGGFTKFNNELSETPIGRVLMGNGNLAAVRKVFEAVYHYKRRGPGIGGVMTDIQAANETMAFISTFYAPMFASGTNDPNPVYINSPNNNLKRVDWFQALTRYTALDAIENQRRLSLVIDAALLAAIGSNKSFLGGVQRQWNTTKSNFFSGMHWGPVGQFGAEPKLGTTFLYRSVEARGLGLDILTVNGIDMSKATVLVDGKHVPLSGPGSESLKLTDRISAAYKAYLTDTSDENPSGTLIAQNYIIRHDSRTNSMVFYLRPDTLVEGAGKASIPTAVYVPDKFGNRVPMALPVPSLINYADYMVDKSAWSPSSPGPRVSNPQRDALNAAITERLLETWQAPQGMQFQRF